MYYILVGAPTITMHILNVVH